MIIGAGGHASVLVDILMQQNREILGIVSPQIESESLVKINAAHYLKDEDVLGFDSKEIKLVNGVGSLPNSMLRAALYKKFSEAGYEFETIVADSSTVSSFATLLEGVQILHGAIIQAGSVIGENSIVNTGAQVDHDCQIGHNNHIAPGAILSGGVATEEFVHFGTNSAAMQYIKIGRHSVVGAGATATQDIPERTVCYPSRNTLKESFK